MNKKQIKSILGIITFGIILFALIQNLSAAWAVLGKILDIFSPVITGFCMAFVLNVLLRVLENRVFFFMGHSNRKWVARLQRPVSLTATLLVTFGLLTILLLVIIPDLRETILRLIENMPSYLESAQKWLGKIQINGQQIFNTQIDWDKLFETIRTMLTPGTENSIVETAAGVTTSVISSIMDLAFGLFISLYILAQKEKIGRFAVRLSNALFPMKVSVKLHHICTVANNSFSNFITGQLTEAVILGALCFVGMLIFRFPNAAIISILIGVTALVPIVGPLIGEIIGCLLILTESPLKALLFLVFVLILQLIEGDLIYPRVVGRSVGLPGVIVLIAVVVGGNLGGMLGILLGVPVASVVYTLVLDWLDNRKQPYPDDPA